MITQTLTKRDARKVLAVVDAGLVSGLGVPEPGKMCVEAAICFALGYEHNDQPKCVAPLIRNYKIGINDAKWSSNEARTKGMRRAAIAQLGSTGIDENEWAKYVSEQIIRRVVPLSLRHAAKLHPDKEHKKKLIDAALRCEKEGTQDAARAASDAASAARAASYAASDAASAARAASYAASDAASYAARAASYAASDAASAARAASDAASAARAASYAAKLEKEEEKLRDKILSTAAEICVEACIKCKTQGSKWLDIAA